MNNYKTLILLGATRDTATLENVVAFKPGNYWFMRNSEDKPGGTGFSRFGLPGTWFKLDGEQLQDFGLTLKKMRNEGLVVIQKSTTATTITDDVLRK